MKEPHEEMENLFRNLQGNFDTEEPILGHQQRFLDRLDKPKKKKRNYGSFLAIAASLAILVAVTINYTQQKAEPTLAKLSPELKESHQYFNSIIKNELAKIASEKSPENQIIISDALTQMQALDKDYEKLMAEMAQKGENEQIISAMITNLQTRVSFLQKVQAQIQNIKKIKAIYHEKTTL